MPLYGGPDLHANNRVVVLLNEQDQGIAQRRLSLPLPTMLEQLAPYHSDIKGVDVALAGRRRPSCTEVDSFWVMTSSEEWTCHDLIGHEDIGKTTVGKHFSIDHRCLPLPVAHPCSLPEGEGVKTQTVRQKNIVAPLA
jgi:hypothetical protein